MNNPLQHINTMECSTRSSGTETSVCSPIKIEERRACANARHTRTPLLPPERLPRGMEKHFQRERKRCFAKQMLYTLRKFIFYSNDINTKRVY